MRPYPTTKSRAEKIINSHTRIVVIEVNCDVERERLRLRKYLDRHGFTDRWLHLSKVDNQIVAMHVSPIVPLRNRIRDEMEKALDPYRE